MGEFTLAAAERAYIAAEGHEATMAVICHLDGVARGMVDHGPSGAARDLLRQALNKALRHVVKATDTIERVAELGVDPVPMFRVPAIHPRTNTALVGNLTLAGWVHAIDVDGIVWWRLLDPGPKDGE